MPLEIQKMIVSNQKPPSTIFQQGRLGEFFFPFRLTAHFCLFGFFCMQIIYSPSVFTTSQASRNNIGQYSTAQWATEKISRLQCFTTSIHC